MLLQRVQKCDNCESKDICKYVDKMEKTLEEAAKLCEEAPTPISVNVTCGKFTQASLGSVKSGVAFRGTLSQVMGTANPTYTPNIQ